MTNFYLTDAQIKFIVSKIETLFNTLKVKSLPQTSIEVICTDIVKPVIEYYNSHYLKSFRLRVAID